MSDTNSHQKYDKYVKQAIQQSMDESPEPSIPEDEMWARIEKDLFKKSANQTVKDEQTTRIATFSQKFNKNKVWVVAASLAAVLLLTLIISAPSGDAFFRVSEMFTRVQDSVTQIFFISGGSVGEEQAEDSPPKDIAVIPEIKDDEFLSFDQAQSVTSFIIVKPLYVPDGYLFQHIHVIYTDEDKSYEIHLIYSDGMNQIRIHQKDLNITSGVRHHVDSDMLKEIHVNSKNVSILPLGENQIAAYWEYQDVFFYFRGRIHQEELVKMIKSM